MNKTTTTERLALVAIAIGLLMSGYLDAQDAKMAERYSVAQSGQQLACTDCAGGVR